jgi:hypothetical protein
MPKTTGFKTNRICLHCGITELLTHQKFLVLQYLAAKSANSLLWAVSATSPAIEGRRDFHGHRLWEIIKQFVR